MLKDQKMNKHKGRLPTKTFFQNVRPTKTLFWFRAAIALCFLFVFFLTFHIVSAQIEITEIMYDLCEDSNGSRADGGREWIEIFNSGSEDIDLKEWKLVDKNDGGHPFSIIQRSFIIKAKEYLIIADFDSTKDDSTFLTDYPNFSDTILNSNFNSFNDTNDIWILKNTVPSEISRVKYSKNQGANGDGNSLQKINGKWVASFPTPGEANSQSTLDFQPVEENNPSTASETPQIQNNNPISPAPEYIEPQIFAQIIPPVDTPIAGADFFFEGEALGLKNEAPKFGVHLPK